VGDVTGQLKCSFCVFVCFVSPHLKHQVHLI
jgi:hypothetical protein